MIKIQDLYNILGNRISNEMQKAIIRNNCPPQIAERMCDAIDAQEKAEHAQEPGTVMPTPASWEFGSRSDSAGKDKMDIL